MASYSFLRLPSRLLLLSLALIAGLTAAVAPAMAEAPRARHSGSGADVAWSMVIRGRSEEQASYYDDARRLIRNIPSSLRAETSLGCIAVAIYHEARNQSTFGQLAVGSVIQTRAATPNRFGDTPCAVVSSADQFSFMTSRYGFPPILENDAWIVAVNLAVKSLVDGPLPQLRMADHYHTNDVDPSWSHKMILIGKIDKHLFYRDPENHM